MEEAGDWCLQTDLCHLRSFTAFGEAVPLEYHRKQRLLRAIDLVGCRNCHLHRKSFSKLYLLKYLSLRNTGLFRLPDSIGDLQNLEFLDIRGTYIEELPNSIVKLQKLVHLLTGRYVKMFSHKVYKLRFINVPKGIRRLKKLRKLGMVRADNVQLLQEIGELVDLQKLGICFNYGQDLAIGMLEEISALLSKLNSSLRSLIILHEANGNLKKTLDEVASPPLLLCKLKIDAYLGGLPAWFASLNQIVEIHLQSAGLSLQDLQVLRNLHSLVKLVLGMNSFFWLVFFDRGGFTHLKFLEIDIGNVIFEEGAVQSLEILKISSFDRVKGIKHLHGLKEVHIQSHRKDKIEMAKNIAANHSNRPKCFVTLHST